MIPILNAILLAFSLAVTTNAIANDNDISLVGAIAEASPDGAVPAWQGGLKTAPKADRHHSNPFSKEAPLFIIDSNNVATHEARLSEGLKALLNHYPGTFRIPVYQSHRSTTYPDSFYRTMKELDQTKTKLSLDGTAIENPIAGVNFPQPKSGLEAIWNHLTRWRSRFMKRNILEGIVYDNGHKKLFRAQQEVSFELYRNADSAQQEKAVLLYYFSSILEPPNLAGGALLAVDYLNQQRYPRQTWSYDAGQRRIKRLPFITHDNPAIMAESLRTADDTDMFSGSPDRFDWHLAGRQIMYIPYNSYLVSSPEARYEDLLTPNHMNPQFTRFEAHRVWKVVATLKPNQRHIYTKRVFYIDEDSWSIVIADQYDQQGNIWRISMAHLKHYYEVPLTFSAADVFHDLKTGYYHFGGLTNEEINSGEFTKEPPPASYFTPSGMRSRVKR